MKTRRYSICLTIAICGLSGVRAVGADLPSQTSVGTVQNHIVSPKTNSASTSSSVSSKPEVSASAIFIKGNDEWMPYVINPNIEAYLKKQGFAYAGKGSSVVEGSDGSSWRADTKIYKKGKTKVVIDGIGAIHITFPSKTVVNAFINQAKQLGFKGNGNLYSIDPLFLSVKGLTVTCEFVS